MSTMLDHQSPAKHGQLIQVTTTPVSLPVNNHPTRFIYGLYNVVRLADEVTLQLANSKIMLTSLNLWIGVFFATKGQTQTLSMTVGGILNSNYPVRCWQKSVPNSRGNLLTTKTCIVTLVLV